MPILLKSIPLSFKTFLRYLILLPVLALGAFIISLAGIIPILGFLVPGTVSAGLIIVGLRCALAARGHGNALDTGKLFRVSLIFCVINIGADLFLRVVHTGMAWGLLQSGFEPNPTQVFAGVLMGLYGLSFEWTAILLVILSPTALVAAALAVPMTAAAASATPRGRGIDVWFGFGSGLFSLMVVSAVWLLCGNLFSYFGEIWTSFGLIATALWALAQNEPLPWSISLDPWTALISTLLMTWASSWFFATAVLAWEQKVEQLKAKQSAERAANTPSPDDIRALRRKRM